MRVSIVLCTYQGARFLEPQLDSFLAQTRPPDEVVIHDDASTDETVKVLEAYRNRLPVRLTAHAANVGSTRRFARAIEEACGDLIVLADQDDVWAPRKIERLESVCVAGADLAFSDAELIDEAGALLGKRLWATIGLTDARRSAFREQPLRILARGKNVVTGATLAFRADLRDRLLPIPPEWTHDGWIAIVGACAGRLEPVAEPLVRYRIHPGQQLGLEPERSSYSRVPGALLGQLHRYEEALERVRPFAGAEDLRWIEGFTRHLAVRAALSPSRLRRGAPVLRELTSGRYRVYSNGLRSALKDLLGRAPRSRAMR